MAWRTLGRWATGAGVGVGGIGHRLMIFILQKLKKPNLSYISTIIILPKHRLVFGKI
jgi:predicted membrane protein